MAIDLVRNFAKHEKILADYIDERIGYYQSDNCFKLLQKRIDLLNASWDMRSGDENTLGRFNFKTQMSYGLVKQQQLARRAVFSNNFRAEPLFTPKAIGNTPDENAINMRDLIQANNEQTHFRNKILMPGNGSVAKIGIAVVFTEYCNDKTMGWRTVSDQVMGSRRVYGPIRNTHNAVNYLVSPLNYFQDPKVTESDESSFRGHLERWPLASLVNKYRRSPGLYIKENIEAVIRKYSKDRYQSEFYKEPGKTTNDFGKCLVNDVIRGQFQFHIDGNEDDSTYYYVEKVGDTIIRFQDNPYDMNMNHYTVLTCERRDEYFWGNTPPEYSLMNENNMNLLLSISLDNAIESMRRYVLYNKNVITSEAWRRAAHDGKVAVDVTPDVALQNIFYTYQVPDNSGESVGNAYARLLENDQRFSSTPDINRPTSLGGPTNKTATAVNQVTEVGSVKDADILERLSFCWASVGEKESIVLMQFLGNFGPILVRPGLAESMKIVTKEQITGNYSFAMDTALQQNYMGEILRYQNIVTWLQNLINGGAQIPPNIYPFVEQVLKMGKFLKVDEYLDNQARQMSSPSMVPTAPVPGMEMAGAAQEAGAPI